MSSITGSVLGYDIDKPAGEARELCRSVDGAGRHSRQCVWLVDQARWSCERSRTVELKAD